MAEPSNWEAYDAVLQAKKPSPSGDQSVPAAVEDVPEKDPVEEMGTESRRVVKKLIQIARDKYSDSFDVIAAEKYQRRLNKNEPDKPFQGYAVIQRLVVDHEGKLSDIRLEIRSRKLCAVIKDLAAHFGAQVNLDTIPIVFRRPFQPLFFLYRPLEKYLTTEKPLEALKEEIELLLSFIKSPVGLKTTITAYSEQVELHKVSFGVLWSLFPPGTVVYSDDGIMESCFVVESTEYFGENLGFGGFRVNAVEGFHDGERYGLVRTSRTIPVFPGLATITPENLAVVPLDSIYPEHRRLEIRERLIARGRLFCELQKASMSHRSYEGPFWPLSRGHHGLQLGKHMQIHSRVVVDYRALIRLNTLEPPTLVASSLRKLFTGGVESEKNKSSDKWSLYGSRQRMLEVKDESGILGEDADIPALDDLLHEDLPTDGAHADRLDEEYLICPPDIRCFFLAEQQWGGILVEHLSSIQWSEGAFDKLQMQSFQKDTIKALVQGFDPQREVDFDDAIQHKGRGLVFLLHGEPGLGKTFTAESIAEHARLPLYHVTTGQLSDDVSKLETELKAIFELGHRWKAVVLVDEADVLMAQRTENDLTRNAVVAVFLRLIEYYRGLLFLTTNRLQGLDTAFHNRIHVKIAYPQLAHDARTQIWRNLLTGSKVKLSESWPDEVFPILGQLQANGRDIRNILRIAHSLRDGMTERTSAVETIITAIRINRADQSDPQLRAIDEIAERLRSIEDWGIENFESDGPSDKATAPMNRSVDSSVHCHELPGKPNDTAEQKRVEGGELEIAAGDGMIVS